MQYRMYESNNAVGIGLRFADSENAARRIGRDGHGKEVSSFIITGCRDNRVGGLRTYVAGSILLRPCICRSCARSIDIRAVIRRVEKSGGFFANLFAKSKVDVNGEAIFRDHGVWGSYDGDVDGGSNRVGKGTRHGDLCRWQPVRRVLRKQQVSR